MGDQYEKLDALVNKFIKLSKQLSKEQKQVNALDVWEYEALAQKDKEQYARECEQVVEQLIVSIEEEIFWTSRWVKVTQGYQKKLEDGE